MVGSALLELVGGVDNTATHESSAQAVEVVQSMKAQAESPKAILGTYTHEAATEEIRELKVDQKILQEAYEMRLSEVKEKIRRHDECAISILYESGWMYSKKFAAAAHRSEPVRTLFIECHLQSFSDRLNRVEGSLGSVAKEIKDLIAEGISLRLKPSQLELLSRLRKKIQVTDSMMATLITTSK